MKKILKTTHPGFIVAILCVVVALLIILAVAGSAAVIGDRQGAGYDGKLVGDNSGGGNGGVSCAGQNAINFDASYYPWVQDAAKKFMNGDEAALIAMIQVESGWHADAYNSSSASGLGQFVTSTARSKNYPQFNGGTDWAGDQWSAGTIYSSNNPNDARFDAKRSIYAAAQFIGSAMQAHHDDVGEAYQESYHGYCKDMSNPNCVKQLNEAKAGRARLEKYYNDLKSGGCTVNAPTAAAPANGQCMNVAFIKQVASSYCGAASQAMVSNFFKPSSTVQGQAFQYSHHSLSLDVVRTFSGQKSYTSLSSAPNSYVASPNMDAAINSIKKGYPVIPLTDLYGQHIFVLTGYDDASQTFFANDTLVSEKFSKCVSTIDHVQLTKQNLAKHLKTQGGNYFLLVK